MSFDITNKARIASEQTNINPQIILEIDGVSNLFGAVAVKKYVKIGDTGLKIDGTWKIGGLRESEDSTPYVSFDASGTSTSIKQSIDHDKGETTTISSMSITLIDKNEEITQLISPGNTITDILGEKAKLWLGFANTGFPDDYIILFRGRIDDIEAGLGYVTLNIAHPDQKKRSEIFQKVDTELSSAITSGDTTVTVDSASNLFYRQAVGPVTDTDFTGAVRIDDEIMYVTNISGSDLTVERGKEGTTAASHDAGATAESFYILEGNVIDMALKLMLSDSTTSLNNYVSLSADNFVRIDPGTAIENTILFKGLDIVKRYNIVKGDYVDSSGATESENNFTDAVIEDIVETENGGTYIVLDSSTLSSDLVEESGTGATIDFKSKYSTLPEGVGMSNDEVDIKEHEKLRDWFFSSSEYKFYLKDTVNLRDFLQKEIYRPLSMFAIPRKSMASVGYHIPPLPTENVPVIDSKNVVNASKLRVRRTSTKNFYNSIAHKYEESALEDKFLRGVITTNATSLSRIPVGNKVLKIESKGLRQAKGGGNLASSAADRLLKKFKFGAEFVPGLRLMFRDGFRLEIGDVVFVDMADLKLSDIQNATRNGDPRLFEITNKKLNIKTGEVELDILDTNFSLDVRYCLIGPSSKVDFGVSTTEFVIKASYSKPFGDNEYKKWEDLEGAGVRIRNSDFSVNESSTIDSIDNNKITLSSALSFTPQSDYIMEFSKYDNQPDKVKLIYGFMGDGSNFADGKQQYNML